MTKKIVHIQYYALLREERGLSEEDIQTSSATAEELYRHLKDKFQFKLSTKQLKVAINNEFADWNTPLKENDSIVFIPPVAGG